MGKKSFEIITKRVMIVFKKITLQLQAQNTDCWLIIQVESFSNSEQEKKRTLLNTYIQRE